MYPWILLIVAVLLSASFALIAWQLDPSSSPGWGGIFLLIGYGLAMSVPMNLEVRRQSILVTAAEIPLVISLFYLTPFWAIIVRMAAGALIYGYRVIQGRGTVMKALYNIANTGVGIGCAALIVKAFGLGASTDVNTWLVLLSATVVSIITTSLGVVCMVVTIQGTNAIEPAVQNVVTALLPNAVNIALGVLVLVIIDATPWSVIPLLVLFAVVAIAYRGYSNMAIQRRSLAELNDFTQSVSQAVQSDRLIDLMTRQLADMLNAECATVWLPAEKRFPEVLLSAYLDVEGLLDTTPLPSELRQHVVNTGDPLLITARHGSKEHRALLRKNGIKDAILVPLRSGTVSYGCLAVTNRLGGNLLAFSENDMRLFETLAAHASVAVENSRLVDRLRFDAYHDALTKLPNRRRLMKVLEDAISITVSGEVVAVMIFDVDKMRDINESVGHAAGDQLIAEFGRLLRAHAPDAAHVGRVDGDEFALVMRIPSTQAAVELAESIRESMRTSIELGDVSVDIDSAVGISIHPETGNKADTLLQRADVATQTAKRHMKGIQVYNAGLESVSVRRMGLATDLRSSIDSGEIRVHFQPKISLPKRQVVGVECLARWKHPTHGDVPPADFIPVAEHTGQLNRITEIVLRESLQRVPEWREFGFDLGIAINLTARVLASSGFYEKVRDLLAEYDVSPEKLTFELTEEDMLGRGQQAPDPLIQLRELGVNFSVDDFGKGDSSLSYLRKLPASEIKIDRTFVQGMATDDGDYAIVRAVVDLARHFQLSIVAEGVESEMTLAQLTEIGCEIAQGFYFSRPLSAARFQSWLAAQNGENRGKRRLRSV